MRPCHGHDARCADVTCDACDCCIKCPDDCSCPGCTHLLCGCPDYTEDDA